MTVPPLGAIVGIGEVLWDLLPAGRQLGGAPFNFTFHCHQLGHRAVMISRVGHDQFGIEIRAELNERGLTDAFVQKDPERPTGTVAVALAPSGEPEYTITEWVAYDALTAEPTWPALLGQARAVCFGTLAQRDPRSRSAIHEALRLANQALIVYDINLRQQYYDPETLEMSLHACQWVKLNADELQILQRLFHLKGSSEREQLSDLCSRYRIELACLTRGADGCLVWTRDETLVVPGIHVEVVDTVGAGDAFTAGLLTQTLEGKSLEESAAFANRLAARVAASAGGTPKIERSSLENG